MWPATCSAACTEHPTAAAWDPSGTSLAHIAFFLPRSCGTPTFCCSCCCRAARPSCSTCASSGEWLHVALPLMHIALEASQPAVFAVRYWAGQQQLLHAAAAAEGLCCSKMSVCRCSRNSCPCCCPRSCTLVNSPLATNVTGQMKDILTTALGMVIFQGATACSCCVVGCALPWQHHWWAAVAARAMCHGHGLSYKVNPGPPGLPCGPCAACRPAAHTLPCPLLWRRCQVFSDEHRRHPAGAGRVGHLLGGLLLGEQSCFYCSGRQRQGRRRQGRRRQGKQGATAWERR